LTSICLSATVHFLIILRHFSFIFCIEPKGKDIGFFAICLPFYVVFVLLLTKWNTGKETDSKGDKNA